MLRKATVLGKSIGAVAIVAFLTHEAAWAGPLENGLAASKRGDHVGAVRIWRPLAEQGDPAAQTNLGLKYYTGQGVPRDFKEAEKWMRRSALQGYADGQYNLGVWYAEGKGTAQNHTEALKWYRLAATQGNVDAQYNLGSMYSKGQGTAKDDKEAARWYRLAAEQGDPHGQYNIGVKYLKGEGVPRDPVRAQMWWLLAAASGSRDAVQNRDELGQILTPQQNANAKEMARRCEASKYKQCG